MRLLFPVSGQIFIGRPFGRLCQMQIRPLLQQRLSEGRLAVPQDGMQENFVAARKSQRKIGQRHGELTDKRTISISRGFQISSTNTKYVLMPPSTPQIITQSVFFTFKTTNGAFAIELELERQCFCCSLKTPTKQTILD